MPEGLTSVRFIATCGETWGANLVAGDADLRHSLQMCKNKNLGLTEPSEGHTRGIGVCTKNGIGVRHTWSYLRSLSRER